VSFVVTCFANLLICLQRCDHCNASNH
jgi:hypothetical protein